MLSVKGRGRHSNFGIAYFWCLFGAFVTMSALAFARRQEDYHLFILGALSFGAAWLGRTIARHRWLQWPQLHLTFMAASYVLMLTAFYVDNGKNLPLWRELPQTAFWILPTLIAVPVLEGGRQAFTSATGPTSLIWQVRAQVRPHKNSRKESFLRTQVACSVGETPSRGALQTTALLDDPIRQSVRLFGCDRWHDRSWDCHGAGP